MHSHWTEDAALPVMKMNCIRIELKMQRCQVKINSYNQTIIQFAIKTIEINNWNNFESESHWHWTEDAALPVQIKNLNICNHLNHFHIWNISTVKKRNLKGCGCGLTGSSRSHRFEYFKWNVCVNSFRLKWIKARHCSFL